MSVSVFRRVLLSVGLFAGLLLVAGPVHAQCSHLGQTVNCPPGVPVGSSSLFFNPDGSITFTGGLVVPGNFVFMPFVPGPVVTPVLPLLPPTPVPVVPIITLPPGIRPLQPNTSTGQASLTQRTGTDIVGRAAYANVPINADFPLLFASIVTLTLVRFSPEDRERQASLGPGLQFSEAVQAGTAGASTPPVPSSAR